MNQKKRSNPFLVISPTRKSKISLPSLKLCFAYNLKFQLDFEIKRSGCNATCIGQTCQSLTARIKYHQQDDTPETQHVRVFLEGN